MKSIRKVHPHFQEYLSLKSEALIELYLDLRTYILNLYPESNELLYHTHALTSLYSISEKMSNGFCMIPIYSDHLNLGFNKGTLLTDSNKLLKGTGKLIRHIPINKMEDYRNKAVKELINDAFTLAKIGIGNKSVVVGQTISKINLGENK